MSYWKKNLEEKKKKKEQRRRVMNHAIKCISHCVSGGPAGYML